MFRVGDRVKLGKDLADFLRGSITRIAGGLYMVRWDGYISDLPYVATSLKLVQRVNNEPLPLPG